MTQDEIIEMANKAFDESSFTDAEVLRFAKLIAEKEREKCANICEEMAVKDRFTNYYKVAANAIRERVQE